ncbi:MAG: hypothetical protein IJD39_08740 [Clostridia bacterium]|nr:hypothetical protein [Clostridia bacterium]
MNDFSVLLQQVLLEDIHKEELNAALNAVTRILTDINAEGKENPSLSTALRPDEEMQFVSFQELQHSFPMMQEKGIKISRILPMAGEKK